MLGKVAGDALLFVSGLLTGIVVGDVLAENDAFQEFMDQGIFAIELCAGPLKCPRSVH
jgi:hypothetical protein